MSVGGGGGGLQVHPLCTLYLFMHMLRQFVARVPEGS